MGETTVLYVLTTVAQSCAALAAFVGAVGVFRLQMAKSRSLAAVRSLLVVVVATIAVILGFLVVWTRKVEK
jgi:hypothetical protein